MYEFLSGCQDNAMQTPSVLKIWKLTSNKIRYNIILAMITDIWGWFFIIFSQKSSVFISVSKKNICTNVSSMEVDQKVRMMLCLLATAEPVLKLNWTLQHVVIVKELSKDKESSTQKYERITMKLWKVDILSYKHIPFSQALKKVTHLPDCGKRV